MSLTTGTRLEAYEVVALLGVGGMGEVYRAVDTKLGRSVAIKVLPEALRLDPERIARFEREARMLAALNHPHIAQIYGMEQAGAAGPAALHFLIMELVEGETLADCISRGALPLQDALRIAEEMADAPEAAHRARTRRRPPRPEAREREADPGRQGQGARLRSGESDKRRRCGALERCERHALADAQRDGDGGGHDPRHCGLYVARAGQGLPADHRSDVFAFGVVLFEMLTGRQPFRGETAPDVLASVLARDVDFAALPADLNPRVTQLLKRCLDKNPKRRWQAVGDLRNDIQALRETPHAAERTHKHETWFRAQTWAIPALDHTQAAYVRAVDEAVARLRAVEEDIRGLVDLEPLRPRVERLRCFRGVNDLTALTIAAELGDPRRFASAPRAMAFVGLVPSEHSERDETRAWRDHQNGQCASAARPGRGRVALSPSAFRRRRASPSATRCAAGHHCAGLDRAAALVSSVPSTRGAR